MNPTPQDIGKKIRGLRKEKGLTLAGLGKLCRCSSSLLSQIETGAINPSFVTLKAVSDALNLSMASLFEEALTLSQAPFSLMTSGERKTVAARGGVSFQLLSQGMNFPCEFILNRWPPGTSTGEEPYHHQGHECGLLLEGELIVETDRKTYRMKPGDSITLSSSSPHRITNHGKKEAVAVWVNSIPWVFAIG
ncbi:MAG: cupin domain-containing protein [Pseudomonadota bacterium]